MPLMTFKSDALQRFLRAVHRRQVALRVMERAALGTFGACVVASVLAGVMLWRGQDAWSVVAITLLVGAVAGAIWGIATRPTVLAAATEADRQLRTADLLGTAWALGAPARGATSNESFRSTVLALAAARCEGLSPSAVVLHRLGVRAWGGIGLALAFVATLAAMSSGPLQAGTQRTRDAESSRRAARDASRRPIVELAPEDSDLRQTRRDAAPGDDRPIGTNEVEHDAAEADAPSASIKDPAADPSGDAGASSAGAGAAKGTSDPTHVRSRPPFGAQGEPRPPSRADRASAGAGRAAASSIADDSQAGGSLGDGAHATPTPPWRSPRWSGAVEAAARDVRSGGVPDGYRDLVRGYFDAATAQAERR